ncbi:MAG TPA: PqqD family protein [Vicinamibacterales bacterium]|jgi:hypothetical protein|nr:PqqD family protein [Vicinamibacterales bacterium]
MSLDRFRASPHVRASLSADGLVILDIHGGVLLASNAIGARIWELIEERCTSVEIARRLADDYDIPHDRATGDVLAFVAALVARGLLTQETPC